MTELIVPNERIREFVDVYYCPSGEGFPTDQFFPVPTFIRSWIIFCIKGNAKILIDKKEEFVPPKISIKGPFDHPYLFGYTQNKIEAVLVQLSVQGLYELTGKDVSMLRNKYVDLYDILDRDLLDDIDMALQEANEMSDRIKILDDFFVDWSGQSRSFDFIDKSSLVQQAIEFAKKGQFSMPLAGICDHMNVSIKTLERAFKTVTGITPKRYFSGCLFEELSRELVTEKRKRVSEIMSSPFYDFSHVNKWFVRYANLKPSIFNKQEFHALEEIMKHQNQFSKKIIN